MMTQAFLNNDGSVSVRLDMDFEEASDFVRLQLLEYRKDIEVLNDVSQIPVWDAINQVLAHISTPTQLLEMELLEISDEWVATVAGEMNDN